MYQDTLPLLRTGSWRESRSSVSHKTERAKVNERGQGVNEWLGKGVGGSQGARAFLVHKTSLSSENLISSKIPFIVKHR